MDNMDGVNETFTSRMDGRFHGCNMDGGFRRNLSRMNRTSSMSDL